MNFLLYKLLTELSYGQTFDGLVLSSRTTHTSSLLSPLLLAPTPMTLARICNPSA